MGNFSWNWCNACNGSGIFKKGNVENQCINCNGIGKVKASLFQRVIMWDL